jgi:hypothetical protein
MNIFKWFKECLQKKKIYNKEEIDKNKKPLNYDIHIHEVNIKRINIK